jgi:hypothetical protein
VRFWLFNHERTAFTSAGEGENRDWNCPGVRNRPYDAFPGVETACASAAAADASRQPRYTRKLTELDASADDFHFAAVAHGGTLPASAARPFAPGAAGTSTATSDAQAARPKTILLKKPLLVRQPILIRLPFHDRGAGRPH